MNKFVFYFVLVSSIINAALLWHGHFSGRDMTFQAATSAYMMMLIVFIEIYDERRKK